MTQANYIDKVFNLESLCNEHDRLIFFLVMQYALSGKLPLNFRRPILL